jgi:hypothetical protein
MIQLLLLILLKSINSPKNKKKKKIKYNLLRKALAQKKYMAEVNKNRKS